TERTQPPRRGDKRKGDARRAAPAAATGANEAVSEAPATSETSTATAPPPQRRPQRPQPQGRPAGHTGRQDQRSRPPKPKFQSPPRRQPKPKPLIPLTNEMKAGKEPLRTFGDLKQFLELKTQEPQQEAETPAEG